jgi:SAM-dependent methyltransferase
MPRCHCEATDRHFTPARARQELVTYRRRGPTGTARLILNSLRDVNLAAETVLDVGAGIGVLHHELLERGVQRAVHLEVANAYLDAAQEETARRGHQHRVHFRRGDIATLAAELAPADLVTLDRVLCCSPELDALIEVSARKAIRYFALSYPHDYWYVRGRVRWQNARRRWAGDPFRFFVHPVHRIRSLIRAAGFQVRRARWNLNWEVVICTRDAM